VHKENLQNVLRFIVKEVDNRACNCHFKLLCVQQITSNLGYLLPWQTIITKKNRHKTAELLFKQQVLYRAFWYYLNPKEVHLFSVIEKRIVLRYRQTSPTRTFFYNHNVNWCVAPLRFCFQGRNYFVCVLEIKMWDEERRIVWKRNAGRIKERVSCVV
jgi:hypothetical protein